MRYKKWSHKNLDLRKDPEDMIRAAIGRRLNIRKDKGGRNMQHMKIEHKNIRTCNIRRR